MENGGAVSNPKTPLHKPLIDLGRWFQRQKRVLPWRDEPTPYRVWVSEIMLQQTQVVTVVPYFEKFMASFPTVEALAGASEDSVMKHWAGLGYYSRARNLHRAAKLVVAERGGALPGDREGWESVPGVGPYTAGAILSIAYEKPEAILDGNVERVVSRYRAVTRAGGDSFYKRRLWRLAGLGVREAARVGVSPSVFNQALMELGATVCTPRAPQCAVCPLADSCRARVIGAPEAFPPKKPRKVFLDVDETHVAFHDPGSERIWVVQAGEGKWRAGLWDLPALDSCDPLAFRQGLVIGESETRHVVTRHKIRRKTLCVNWDVSKQGDPPAQGGQWVNPHDPEVGLGSAARRSIAEAIRRVFRPDSRQGVLQW
jgi:A/G-specific adenine glycosylase